LEFCFGYKKDGTASISIESHVSEGTEINKSIGENHSAQLVQELAVPIELSEGVKNKDWLRLIAKITIRYKTSS
jgi:hypothetical protein